MSITEDIETEMAAVNTSNTNKNNNWHTATSTKKATDSSYYDEDSFETDNDEKSTKKRSNCQHNYSDQFDTDETKSSSRTETENFLDLTEFAELLKLEPREIANLKQKNLLTYVKFRIKQSDPKLITKINQSQAESAIPNQQIDRLIQRAAKTTRFPT